MIPRKGGIFLGLAGLEGNNGWELGIDVENILFGGVKAWNCDRRRVGKRWEKERETFVYICSFIDDINNLFVVKIHRIVKS